MKSTYDNKANLSLLLINLISKLNRIPSYLDFLNYEDFDPVRIFNFFDSYYDFLNYNRNKINENFDLSHFNEKEEELLKVISLYLGQGIRIHEIICLKLLINNSTYNDFKNEYNKLFNKNISLNEEITLKNILLGKRTTTNKYCLINEDFTIKDNIKLLLNNEILFEYVNDLLDYFIYRNKNKFNNTYKDTNLCLYERYSYRDICQLLNFKKDETAVIGGYKYNKDNNVYPIFINYDKTNDISETIAYEDHFIKDETIHWQSKKNRHLTSSDFIPILNKEMKTKIYLFIRKSIDDKESKKFYFLGEISPLTNGKEIIKEFKDQNNKINKVSYVNITFKLEHQVRHDIYEFLTSNIKDEN